jgi:hypothetical protein
MNLPLETFGFIAAAAVVALMRIVATTTTTTSKATPTLVRAPETN